MHYLVKSGNAYSTLRVELPPHSFMYARNNVLTAFGGDLLFSPNKSTGFLRRLAQKFSGAHLEMQRIEAEEQNAWVILAPHLIGTISGIDLHGKTVLVAVHSFFAASQDISTNGKIYTLSQNNFGSETFKVTRFGGEGVVFVNAIGSVETLSILPEEQVRIHPEHLIAWEEQLAFGSLDRGFITITGPGRLWLQTRSQQGLYEWLGGLKDTHKSTTS